ncbi:MAG: hypothetical protein ACXAD7_05275 [Candidatus Kariarchaeaceae archaeon]|jgi:hypothetical protein
MQNPSLNQFGSVLTYAIELENSLAEYYRKAVENNQSHQDELNLRSKASLKRKKKLERSRRENVTEITLEPIEGLDKNNYILNVEKYSPDVINSNEEVMVRFFTDAGPKLNVLESRRLFKRCHKEHSNLKNL